MSCYDLQNTMKGQDPNVILGLTWGEYEDIIRSGDQSTCAVYNFVAAASIKKGGDPEVLGPPIEYAGGSADAYRATNIERQASQSSQSNTVSIAAIVALLIALYAI